MPEGPEIRRMVDDIQSAVGGKIAERVQFAFDNLQRWESVLAGRKVVDVSARGKAVLVDFEGDRGDRWSVYSHNQLYGKWITGRSDKAPRTKRSLRFAVITDNTAARLYSASEIHVVPTADIGNVPYIARLGPDILNEHVSAKQLAKHLGGDAFCGRALGGLLLDQAFIAGVGNYLRSEILFVAGLHPATRPKHLTRNQIDHLAILAIAQIRQAYAHKGITNDLARAEQLRADGAAFSQRRHHVFARDGLPCYACGTLIEKTAIASRRLYRCPRCQPRRAR